MLVADLHRETLQGYWPRAGCSGSSAHPMWPGVTIARSCLDHCARHQAVESYYEFGGNKIALSQEEVLKIRSMDVPQGITTIGFAPRKLVMKPGHNLRTSWLMRPDDKKAVNSSTTMRSFLKVLEEKDFVAICCIRKRSNEIARLHALVPQSEVRRDRKLITPEGFHVVPLPYADDVRSLPVGFELAQEGERGGAPSREAIDAAKQLVKSVNLGKNFTNSLESGDLRNPGLLRQFAHIEACALGTAVNEDDAVTNVEGARLKMEPPEDQDQVCSCLLFSGVNAFFSAG